MTKAEYIESLREIVDTWTVGVSVAEYRSFLSKLYARVTVPLEVARQRAAVAAQRMFVSNVAFRNDDMKTFVNPVHDLC